MRKRHQSEMRIIKRASMKKEGNTFTQRFWMAACTGKPIPPVSFRFVAPEQTVIVTDGSDKQYAD